MECNIYYLFFRFDEDLDDYSVIMVKVFVDCLVEVSNVFFILVMFKIFLEIFKLLYLLKELFFGF